MTSFNPFISNLVRTKAAQLAKASRRPSDTEDFAQDLIVRLLQAASQFDPDRATDNAFNATVVENQSASIARSRRAKKRDGGVVISLSINVSIEGHPTELAQLIGQRELDARRAKHPRSKEQLDHLVADVRAVVATLPVPLRELAERLMQMSLSQAGEELGLKRTALYVRMVSLRKRFEAAGLKNYLSDF